MAITPTDFEKIWSTNASTPEYTFSDADYLEGWDFVGNLPPTRAQWNAIQKRTDEKMKYVFDNFGAPLTASTVAGMTLQNRVYVYTGSETGYTAGHWYYWNGSAWTDGGVYNSNTVQVDPTLTITGAAADAKVTGDKIAYYKSVLVNNLSQINGKNLFDPLWLERIGITNTDTESYGTSGAFASIGQIPFVVPSGTSFTVSFDAYVEPVQGSSGSGLVFKVLRADGTTLSQQIVIPNNTSTWTSFQMTPNPNFGANGIEFVVSAYENNITHLKNVQIEYGTTKTTYENPLTAKDKKAEESIITIEENISNIETNIENLEQSVKTEIHSDVLYGKEAVRGKYCNPSTGEISNLAFWSVLGVHLPDNADILFPYNINDTTNHVLRSVCFYSSDDQNTSTFISGVAGTAATVNNGILVPANAVSCAVTIDNAVSLSTNYYLSTIKGGDVITTYLHENIKVDAEQIVNLQNKVEIPVQLPNRKPTFCFIFDDGTSGDVNTKALFDSFGFKCGFALLGENSYIESRRERYLQYQDEGFEILSHSVNATPFSNISNLTTAENYLKTSLSVLRNKGFIVNGWVTPSTWLLAEQMPIVCKYYQYGYGHLSGTTEGTAYHQFRGLDIRQLDRWGLEGHTLAETMAKINEAISNNAYMIFYGHSYPGVDNYMTEENMQAILTYLKTKVDNMEIMVDTPQRTINTYYAFRHSDFLAMIE